MEYLQGLSDYREELGIDSLVNVEVLRRKTKDGYSAPDQVVELLEEYLSLRETGDDIFSDIPYEIKNNFAPNFIQLYLEAPESISSKERNEFELALRNPFLPIPRTICYNSVMIQKNVRITKGFG